MTLRFRDGDLVVESVDGVPIYRARLWLCQKEIEVEGRGQTRAKALRDLAEEVEQ